MSYHIADFDHDGEEYRNSQDQLRAPHFWCGVAWGLVFIAGLVAATYLIF